MTPEVKICGLSKPSDIDVVRAAGGAYAGFVHCEKSPRHLAWDTISELVCYTRSGNAANEAQLASVVLVVDPDDDMLNAARAAAPDYIQLHGHETHARVREIREMTGLRIIKAVPVSEPEDVSAATAYLTPGEADILLFDAKPPKTKDALPGGNGLSFDWTILDPLKGTTPFALAGGLNPENARTAADLTGATILDVSSGVEAGRGEKDPDRIRRFLMEVKAANQSGTCPPATA